MKHKKLLSFLAAGAMMINTIGLPVLTESVSQLNIVAIAAEPDVWDGTIDTSWYDDEEMAFHIQTAEELAGLAAIVNAGKTLKGKTIYLDKDIYLNSLVDKDQWKENPPEHVWTPIGMYTLDNHSAKTIDFMGTFNGDNHTIYGMNGTSLFTATKDAVIRDLTLSDGIAVIAPFCAYSENSSFQDCVNKIDVENTKKNFLAWKCNGGICALGKDLSIINCINKGNINAVSKGEDAQFVGGIIGYALSSFEIQNCENSGELFGKEQVSGILGTSSGSAKQTIVNCVNHGNIEAISRANGISNSAPFISDCLNTGAITGASSFGIAFSSKEITRCSNKGTITASYEHSFGIGGDGDSITYCSNYGAIHGSAGHYGGGIGRATNISNCYNRGTIEVEKGGMIYGIGYDSKCQNCYNAGDLIGDNKIYPIGETGGENCYYISTVGVAGVGTAKSATNMKKEATAKALGGAFVYVKDDYPILFWEAGIPLLLLDKTEVEFTEFNQQANISAETSSDETVQWSSDNEKIATVDNEGVITAVGNGTCNIIASIEGVTTMCKVTSTFNYYMEPTEMNMEVDEAKSLSVFSVATQKKAEVPIMFSSSNEDVAEVTDKGVISANMPGTAEIHVMIGDVDLVCTVTVKGVNGDVDVDGELGVSDLIMLQKWIHCSKKMTNPNAGDMNRDGIIDVFDLALMKRALLKKK